MTDGQKRDSVAALRQRIEGTLAALKWANGEYAEILEGNLVLYRRQLERAIALATGTATCGHCEQPVAEGESVHAVCRATSQGE